MIGYQNLKQRVLLISLLAIITTEVFSFSLIDYWSRGRPMVQLGGYWSDQGKSQHINIDGLIGDDFTVTSSHGSNGLVGLSYFIPGQESDLLSMSYGINAFYLPKTAVKGVVIQESLFSNLSYHYDVTSFPIYAMAKSIVNTAFSPTTPLTIEVGIGPNIMRTAHFYEHSLDDITIPDNIFAGHTRTTFSAMAGVGIKLNAFGPTPLECGYKFFYLGQGSLNSINDQVPNNLSTGPGYANALVCAMTI